MYKKHFSDQLNTSVNPNGNVLHNAEAAVTISVELCSDPIDVNAYLIAFLNKLLLQRDKIDMNLLKEHLKSEITTKWKDLLSSLEDRNRKVVKICNGSIVFLLFCPTPESAEQINDETWRQDVTAKMQDFLKELGN